MPIEYQFNKGNLLNEPKKYSFSQYQGRDFLEHYKKSRKEILNDENQQIKSFEEFVEKNSEEFDNDYLVREILNTEKFLKILVKNIVLKQNFDYDVLDIFVKKFEVKKKIFEEYDKEYLQNSERYENLMNYILLSGICLIAYEKRKNLKYLNVSLKLNDLLTNQIHTAKNSEGNFIQFLVKKELEYVENLIAEKISNFG